MRATLRILYVAGLAVATAVLGGSYAVHNTDSHHWGFILGTTLDYLHGKTLFSEVYVQYGAGSFYLFRLLHLILPINYTSIGFAASVAYSLNLVILFVCLERLSSTGYAALLTSTAFLIHPFAPYPWPDYFAGLCLTLASYQLLRGAKETTWISGVAPGLWLFLAYLFRNTYVLNLTVAAGAYLAVSALFAGLRSRRVFHALGVFGGLVAVYLLFLYASGHLGAWYRQNLGAASGTYGIGADAAVRWIGTVLSAHDLPSAVLLALLAANAHLIARMLFAGSGSPFLKPNAEAGTIVFLALLGGAGVIQGMMIYEIFRLQNACSALYMGAAALLNAHAPESRGDSRAFDTRFALTVLVVCLAGRLPHLLVFSNPSTVWPLVERRGPGVFATASSASDAPVFRWHKFEPDVAEYYRVLRDSLCDGRRRIVNLTADSVVPYLCEGQENALSLPFGTLEMVAVIEPDAARRVLEGRFRADEFVVADTQPYTAESVRLVEIASAARPATLRFMRPTDVHVFLVDAR